VLAATRERDQALVGLQPKQRRWAPQRRRASSV
jgi:hypothetical protein